MDAQVQRHLIVPSERESLVEKTKDHERREQTITSQSERDVETSIRREVETLSQCSLSVGRITVTWVGPDLTGAPHSTCT